MKYFLALLLICSTLLLKAQSYYDIADSKSGNITYANDIILGLWEVKKVEVGTEEMTPTARWFEILSGGQFIGGNGGITHTRGAWTYDPNTNRLEQMSNGQRDPFGAFDVLFTNEGNQMTWTRKENGQIVKVTLTKSTEQPLAPWDMIAGSWISNKAEGLDKENKEVKSIYHLDPSSYYFGWDGRYRKYDSNGKRIETGIWHIEAHSPWLWTISDEDNTKTGWSIDIGEKSMTWTKDGDSETLKVYFERAEN